MRKLMIGGQALVRLGSSRSTSDTDYLINDTGSNDMFYHDKENNIDYCNAHGHKFFEAIWDIEKDNQTDIATPQSLLELKAFAFVQHCKMGNWAKVRDCQFDFGFLVANFGLTGIRVANKFMTLGEYQEVYKEIKSVRK